MKAQQGSTQGHLSDELLQRYFDDELSPAERTEVELRLDGDARMRLEALGELRGLLRAQVKLEGVDLDLSETIAAIERAPLPPARARRRLLPLSAAGGLLAAAAAAFFFLMRPVAPVPGMDGINSAQVETLEVEGAIATVFRSEEDDGTIVIWAESDEQEEDEEEEEAVQ